MAAGAVEGLPGTPGLLKVAAAVAKPAGAVVGTTGKDDGAAALSGGTGGLVAD